MKNIVACLDFSDVSDSVARIAAVHGKAMGATLLLFHCVALERPVVVGDMSATSPILADAALVGGIETAAADLKSAKALLTEMEAGLREHGVQTLRLLRMGNCVSHALAVIERYRPEMVVLGSHGHGALHHLLLGSTTQALIKKASCPMLVVPSRWVREQAPVAADSMVA